MIPWGVLFARQVARALEEDPRRDLSAAVEQAGRRLESSLPQGLLVQAREEFERLMKEDPPVFRRRYLLNPRYLAEKLGKRVFIYLVDGRDGRYRTLRRSLQGWKGEHSRFILFGPQDVMVVLYGTEEENGEFLRAFSEENWPVDIIQVESISRWYGRPVPEYRDVPLDQEALQAATRVLQGRRVPSWSRSASGCRKRGSCWGLWWWRTSKRPAGCGPSWGFASWAAPSLR